MLPDLAADDLVAQLRTMLRIRRFEEALIGLAADHDIGHFHVYVGQEATGRAGARASARWRRGVHHAS